MSQQKRNTVKKTGGRMRWRSMKTAPRDGRPVGLLYDDRSGVVVGRYGVTDLDGNTPDEYGWFAHDWSDAISALSPYDKPTRVQHGITDESFIGWTPIPEFVK